MYIEIPEGYINVDAIDYATHGMDTSGGIAVHTATLYLRGGEKVELRGDIAVQVMSYMRGNKIQVMDLYPTFQRENIRRGYDGI